MEIPNEGIDLTRSPVDFGSLTVEVKATGA
jgi:hypothetical protein